MARKDKAETGGWVDLLASLKVTVYTLIALGLAVLAGTIFPQKGVSLRPDQLAHLLHQPLWKVLHALGFLDVFHSIWFFFLVALLIVNLVVCTYRHLRRTQQQLAATGPELDERVAGRVPLTRKIAVTAPVEQTVADLTGRMAKIGKVERNQRGDMVFLFAQNSPLARFGSVVIHLSILFVVAGAMLRLLFGIEGNLLLPEGGQQNIFDAGEGDLRRLPFDVRCDKFEMELYPGTRRPKDYRSTLVLLSGGQEVGRKTIEVNSPLKAGGYRFFQASYGTDTFPLVRIQRAGLDQTLPVFFKQPQSLPGSHDGLMFDEAREEGERVLVHVRMVSGEQEFEDWLTEGGEAKTLGQYQITLVGHREGQYTGILVTADPGVRLVWFGSALFFLGLFWALFTSHRRVWARVKADEVWLAASASKGREVMADWFARLGDELEKK